ncbi:Fc.00g005660.m01.CDS01 [Cosmosporella sp. VM-42]
MFDVIWTDPDRELVGEHRAKKEKKKAQKEKQTLSSRSSLSTRSSRSSVDSPFSLFRSRGPKNASQAGSGTKSSGSSGLMTPSILSSRSPLSIDSDGNSYRHSVAILDSSDLYSEATRAADPRRQQDLSRDSSEHPIEASQNKGLNRNIVITSHQDRNGTYRRGNSSRLIQTLGPSSYITKRTEVSWIPRNPECNKLDLTSEVLISTEPDIDQLITPPTSPGDQKPPTTFDRVDSPVNLNPNVKSPTQPKSHNWSLLFKPNNPDAWRPPNEWDCRPLEPRMATAQLQNLLNKSFPNGLKETPPDECSDMSTLQKEVERMAFASPDVIVSRLKEVWDPNEDASLHQELEMEKKRWMLSVLHHLDPLPENSSARPSVAKSTSTGIQKILALWESKATASYLAVLHPDKQVYHMSAAPLSHSMFPNIHPVLVPSVSPSVFPVALQLFSTVYSLSLPAICPAQDLPGVLKNIHKCLKPGGSLQLTLIDPLPCAGTLGHRMRAWLEEHLLLNLERNFRCMSPSRGFPHWLGEASLRGQGSTLTTAKFYAIPTSARSHEAEPDPFIDQVRTERETKAELRSLVGRMLWMEVWGDYVTAGCWWWEDAACVEECLHLGTFWEYNVIEGVKDS